MIFRNRIAETLAAATGIEYEELYEYLEVPPQESMGDFALPCFKLAKSMRKSPVAIADGLIHVFDHIPYINRVESIKGYLNIFLDRRQMAQQVLSMALEQGQRYGSSEEGQGRKVCIDYSSINIAKPFHIGHLSTTAIGHALYRIYEFMGYRSVGINHLGDWGTQFGKLIVAYKKWGDHNTVEEKSIRELSRLYVLYHEKAEEDPTLDDEARAWFKKIEDGDEQAMELFNWFKELTLREVQKIYKLLDIEFDSYAGESFYNDKMDRVIEELKDKNLLTESEGAQVVDLEPYQMPPCMILKRDGATLYATRDIAAAFYRKDTYDFAKCLYVVAYQQDLHFKQWFKVVELMGHPWYADLKHVSFGMVSMPEGAMSTRKGRVIWLEEILTDAVDKAREIIEAKNPQLENKEQVARSVGIGSVIFAALKNNRIKDIVFNRDQALNFDGETAPYVQYTHARCSSLIDKAGVISAEPDYSVLTDADALQVIRLIENLPEIVADACHRDEPSIVTRYTVSLASAFNKYYFEHRIIEGTDAEISAKIELVRAARYCIAKGLYLIGVDAPDSM